VRQHTTDKECDGKRLTFHVRHDRKGGSLLFKTKIELWARTVVENADFLREAPSPNDRRLKHSKCFFVGMQFGREGRLYVHGTAEEMSPLVLIVTMRLQHIHDTWKMID